MSYTGTYSESSTFTVTNAKHIASKVKTDLMKLHRLYNIPSRERIDEYEKEVIELLKYGFLGAVTYGFIRNDNDKWVVALKYTVKDNNLELEGDDPGNIRRENIDGCRHYSYLEYSDKWFNASKSDKEVLENPLTLSRIEAETPDVENGYWSSDREYYSGSQGMARQKLVKF